jgi:hypothetical protein
MAQKISLFHKAILYGMMLAFVIGISYLPGKHTLLLGFGLRHRTGSSLAGSYLQIEPFEVRSNRPFSPCPARTT